MENNLRKPTLTIHRGWTHAAITILQSCPAASGIGNFIRNSLVEKEYLPEHNEFINGRWRKVWGRWQDKYKYYRYDGKSQKLFIPIAYADDIVVVAKSLGLDVEEKRINDYELRKIDVKMNPRFTDREKQIEPIRKCSEPDPGMKFLNLQTGGGKTYCAVKVSVNLGYATLIIVPGLVDQWIDDIEEYTGLKKGDDIYKIEGFQSIALLAHNPQFKPKYFVASTRTMQMFSNGDEGYDLLPWNYTEFLSTYGIGTKIVDECHKNFNANTKMDLKSNVPFNLYLSATFDQTSKQARKIFKKIFPDDQLIGGETYDRYVTVYFFNFYGRVHDKKCCRAKGYMHSLYETQLLKTDSLFNGHVDEAIIPLLNQFYINRYQKGHRCLVFCSTVEFVNKLTKRLRIEYPNLKVNAYTAGMPRSILSESDLVVSTIGKASTGLDWKGLRCCLNTVSVRSPVLTSQMLGRLRKINGEQLIYVDMCDANIAAQIRHAEDRKSDLARMAAKMCTFDGLTDITTTYQE